MNINNKGASLLNKYREIPLQARLALWLTFSNVIQKGISVITVPIFTRLMDTVEYGKVSAYFSWLSVISIICSFKLNAGVYNKGLSKYKDDQEGFCLSMQYTTSLITVGIFVLYLIFQKPINSITEMGTWITSLMFVEILFSTSMGFWSVRKQYTYSYKSVVSATLFFAVLNPVLGYIFVILTPYELRGTARICSTVLAQIIVGAFFYCVNIKAGKFKFNTEYTKFAIKFNLPLIPHYFSEYILSQSDRIMIQKICTYSQVAFYSVAYNAGMLMTIVSGSINQAITPWVYQSLDKENFEQIRKVLLSLSIILMIPMILLTALAPEAIYILAGKEYGSAVYVIPPVAGSVIFLFLYTNLANIEFYYDYNKITMYISAIGAALNIILNYFFIQKFGYVAAGYTTFLCYLVYFLGHYACVESILRKKNKGRLINGKSVLLLVGSVVTIMVALSFTYKYTVIRYFIILTLLGVACWKRKFIAESLKMFAKK